MQWNSYSFPDHITKQIIFSSFKATFKKKCCGYGNVERKKKEEEEERKKEKKSW